MDAAGDAKKQGTEPNDEQPAPCGSCNKMCTKEDKALECGLCNRWFHITCQGVKDAMYRVITEDSNSDTPLLHWYCKPMCSKLANNFIDTLLKVQSDVSKLGHEVANVRGKVQKIEGEFTPAMVETVKNIATGVEGVAAADIDREEIVKLVEEKQRNKTEKWKTGHDAAKISSSLACQNQTTEKIRIGKRRMAARQNSC
jgi:hypothetical protein